MEGQLLEFRDRNGRVLVVGRKSGDKNSLMSAGKGERTRDQRCKVKSSKTVTPLNVRRYISLSSTKWIQERQVRAARNRVTVSEGNGRARGEGPLQGR